MLLPKFTYQIISKYHFSTFDNKRQGIQFLSLDYHSGGQIHRTAYFIMLNLFVIQVTPDIDVTVQILQS